MSAREPETTRLIRGPAPIYEQIKQHIVRLIGAQGLKPGDKLPSENELVKTLGVSRMSVNRALRELSAQGLIQRVAGVGSFVSEARTYTALLQISNIGDEIAGRGDRYSWRLISRGRMPARAEVAGALDLRHGTDVFYSRIVHLENGQPLQFEDRFVNPATVPAYLEQDFTATTPHAYLIAVAPITAAEHRLEAIVPDLETQRFLNLEPGDPCLQAFRRTWSHGQSVTCVWLRHPGQRYAVMARYEAC